MKVYTHYPALAPAIQDAGYEPVLLEPLNVEPGSVKVQHVNGMLVIDNPRNTARPLLFERADLDPIYGWELVR